MRRKVGKLVQEESLCAPVDRIILSLILKSAGNETMSGGTLLQNIRDHVLTLLVFLLTFCNLQYRTHVHSAEELSQLSSSYLL